MTGTDDVTADVNAVTGSGEAVAEDGGMRSYLYTPLPTSPITSDESRRDTYRMIPSLALPSMTLTVPQTKADEGILQKLMIWESSAWLIFFSLYSLRAHFAPMGKPHTSPRSAAHAPSPESPKAFDMGTLNTARMNESAHPDIRKSEIIMNGNRDGTRLLTHRARDALIYSIEALGDMRSRAKSIRANAVMMIFPCGGRRV